MPCEGWSSGLYADADPRCAQAHRCWIGRTAPLSNSVMSAAKFFSSPSRIRPQRMVVRTSIGRRIRRSMAEPDDADGQHADHDARRLEVLLGVEDRVAQAVGAGDHLAADQRAEAEGDAEANAGHQVGQRRGEDHVPHDGGAAGAQGLHGLDQHRLHHADAGQQVVQHREEDRHHDDEQHRALAQPEPQDGEGDPGEAGDGLQQVDQRIEEVARDRGSGPSGSRAGWR